MAVHEASLAIRSMVPATGSFRPEACRLPRRRRGGAVSAVRASLKKNGSAVPELDPDSQTLPLPSLSVKKVPVEIVPPPRICTLRNFGENESGVARIDPETMSSFFASLAANVEFSLNIQTWEILSGRLAMIVFACAVTVEAITGNTLFEKVDIQRVEEIGAAGLIAIFGAAGFAFAWGAKFRVMGSMSKGAENLVNSFIDNIIDSLFFDDDCNHSL